MIWASPCLDSKHSIGPEFHRLSRAHLHLGDFPSPQKRTPGPAKEAACTASKAQTCTPPTAKFKIPHTKLRVPRAVRIPRHWQCSGSLLTRFICSGVTITLASRVLSSLHINSMAMSPMSSITMTTACRQSPLHGMPSCQSIVAPGRQDCYLAVVRECTKQSPLGSAEAVLAAAIGYYFTLLKYFLTSVKISCNYLASRRKN